VGLTHYKIFTVEHPLNKIYMIKIVSYYAKDPLY